MTKTVTPFRLRATNGSFLIEKKVMIIIIIFLPSPPPTYNSNYHRWKWWRFWMAPKQVLATIHIWRAWTKISLATYWTWERDLLISITSWGMTSQTHQGGVRVVPTCLQHGTDKPGLFSLYSATHACTKCKIWQWMWRAKFFFLLIIFFSDGRVHFLVRCVVDCDFFNFQQNNVILNISSKNIFN